MMYLKSISDEWLNAICWSSRFLEIFIIRQCLEIGLIVFSTEKQDCVIKTKEMFNFLSLNHSVLLD